LIGVGVGLGCKPIINGVKMVPQGNGFITKLQKATPKDLPIFDSDYLLLADFSDVWFGHALFQFSNLTANHNDWFYGLQAKTEGFLIVAGLIFIGYGSKHDFT
jgi:hypothetical protein